ncbi:MAG TPA: MFS transporter [Anaerolineales bacterium]|nr:MFS transporter [Anaerolineales bacterium]
MTDRISEWQSQGFARPARRIRWVLFAAMGLSSAAVIAMATVSPIAAAEIGGSPAWAGVPAAMVLIGAMLSSPAWGPTSDALGRRKAVVLGLILGTAGAVIAGWGLGAGAGLIFFAGLLPTGTASAAIQLSRFAAGEVHPPELSARAISTVVLGGTVGSIAGPLLVGPTGIAATRLGVDELVGPFVAAAGLFALAAAVVFFLLRPDPRDLGRQTARLFQPDVSDSGPARSVWTVLTSRPGLLAVAAMALGQMVMIMVMVMTALHMRDHRHGLSSISLVIASHTFGMYAFSVFSGRLADRYGRVVVISGGAALLGLACLTAPLSPDVLPLAVSLFLLGFGWNLCFVAGSALLDDQLRPAERGRTQGINDLLVGAASAVGSLASGVLFRATGYGGLALVGAGVAMIPLVLGVMWRRLVPATT